MVNRLNLKTYILFHKEVNLLATADSQSRFTGPGMIRNGKDSGQIWLKEKGVRFLFT